MTFNHALSNISLHIFLQKTFDTESEKRFFIPSRYSIATVFIQSFSELMFVDYIQTHMHKRVCNHNKTSTRIRKNDFTWSGLWCICKKYAFFWEIHTFDLRISVYYVCLKFERNVKTRPICSRFNFNFNYPCTMYIVHTTSTLGISLYGWDKNVPVHSSEPKNLRLRIWDLNLQYKSSNNWTFSLHFLKLRTNPCFGTKTKLFLTNPLPKKWLHGKL